MRDVAGESLGTSDVFGAGDRTHLRAVERDNLTAYQALFPAEGDERRAHCNNRFGVVVPECGDGAVIGRQAAYEPHRLQIAQTCPLQLTRRAQLVEVTPDVEPQHVAWMIARSSRRCRHRTIKTELGEIKATNESIDDANQRVLADIVINTGWKQARLLPVMSFDKAAHWPSPR